MRALPIRFWNTRYSRSPSAAIQTGDSGRRGRRARPLSSMASPMSARVWRSSFTKSIGFISTLRLPVAALLTSNTSRTMTWSRLDLSERTRM